MDLDASLVFDPIDPVNFISTEQVQAEIDKMLKEEPLMTRQQNAESIPEFKNALRIVKSMAVEIMAAKVTGEVLENYMKDQSAENEWDLFMSALQGAPPNETFSDGTYGYFSERNLFGEQPNSRIESDIQMYREGIGRRLMELKTSSQKTITVGSFKGLESIDRDALLYYKMLIKMQNLLVITTKLQKGNKEYFRLEKAILYTTLLWDKLKKDIEYMMMGKAAPSILTYSEERELGTPYIKYKLTINLRILEKDYKRLYANKYYFFKDPYTRKLFFKALRAIRQQKYGS